jgi:iron complex transport system permease protein
MVASVMFGVTNIDLQTVIASFTAFDGSNEHLIIQTARVPRALIAVAVGGSLAIAGALMQAVTRNPLATPSLFGINSGASFFIVVAAGFFGVSEMSELSIVALLGAAAGTIIVYTLGSLGKDGLTPIKVTLAGAAMTAFFSALTQGVLLGKRQAFEQVLYWLVGSVAGRDITIFTSVFPYMAAGIIGSFFLASHMNVLSMGEDVAKGLGQRTGLIKGFAALIVVLLAGASVAAAGPVAFVGLIVPHIMRYFVGTDYRWIIPFSVFGGAILLLASDIGSRYIAMPKEVPVGVMTAIIGVPFFIYIARKGGRT